jgi:hypothetical protein
MKRFKLDGTNLAPAVDYIRDQFDTRSWWPKEQPQLAKEEFLQMQQSPDALNAWCEKWLYSGQWRQLEKHVAEAARKRS